MTQTPFEVREFDFSQVCPKHIIEAINNIPPEWLNLNETDLKEKCFHAETLSERASASRRFKTDQALRHSFWLEYELAHQEKRMMQGKNIYSGIVQPFMFCEIIRDARRLAWIIHPPGNYVAEINALLMRAVRKYDEILDIPIMKQICRCYYRCRCKKDEDGVKICACENKCKCPPTYDTKAADVAIKVAQQIELRTRGSIPQVINQKTLNVNLNRNQQLPSPTTEEARATIVSTREELLALRQQHEALLSGTRQPQLQKEVIEVENVGDNKDEG